MFSKNYEELCETKNRVSDLESQVMELNKIVKNLTKLLHYAPHYEFTHIYSLPRNARIDFPCGAFREIVKISEGEEIRQVDPVPQAKKKVKK